MIEEKTAIPTRPLRLWVAGVGNILIGSLAVGFMAFLIFSERVPLEAKPSGGALVFGIASAVILIAASVGAIWGNWRARKLLLWISTVYFGSVILQNLSLLFGENQLGLPTTKLFAAAFRSSLMLALNLWALKSSATLAFFQHKNRPEHAREEEVVNPEAAV